MQRRFQNRLKLALPLALVAFLFALYILDPTIRFPEAVDILWQNQTQTVIYTGVCLIFFVVIFLLKRPPKFISRLNRSTPRNKLYKQVENANIILLSFAPNGQIISLNHYAESFFGFTAESLIGNSLINTIVPKIESSGRQLDSLYQNIQNQPENYPTHDCEHIRQDGSKVWVMWTNQPTFNSQGELIQILSLGQDISKQKQYERKLLLTASVFDYSVEGIMITDLHGSILRVNRAFCDLTGLSRDQVSGKNAACIYHKPDIDSFRTKLWNTLQTDGIWQGEIWSKRREDKLYPAWLSLSSVKNKKKQTTHYVGLLSDIADKKQSEKRIQQLAFFDELTELPNRVLFVNRLTHTLEKAARQNLRIPILCINLNRFKSINDTLGQDQGDLLLNLVAKQLGTCIRGSDTIARMGADEFTVIVEPVENRDEVIRIGSRISQSIIESVARPFDLNGYDAFISLSIGIVSYPDDGLQPNELIKNARTTVTHATRRGTNCYLFYEPKMNATAMKRMQMATDMHKALDNGEFQLYYQPTLNLLTGQINGCEALARWIHPELGIVMPLQFIPLAEETGLIVPLGEWVFAEAIRQTKEWQNEGIDILRIAINLSMYNLRAKELLRFIRLMLNEIQLPPNLVALELTESIFMADMDDVQHVLHELDEIGIQLLIDDFGTGYSSLSRLKELPAQTLKIDRSFIHDIPYNPDNASLVSAIIAMAHSLNMSVIAEGIETEEQLVFLMEQRCDEVQGFLISKPVPAEEFKQLISNPKQSKSLHVSS